MKCGNQFRLFVSTSTGDEGDSIVLDFAKVTFFDYTIIEVQPSEQELHVIISIFFQPILDII